jgi:hypothetical protein
MVHPLAFEDAKDAADLFGREGACSRLRLAVDLRDDLLRVVLNRSFLYASLRAGRRTLWTSWRTTSPAPAARRVAM